VIILEHNPSQSLPLKPVDTDAFQISRMMIRFLRDKSGRVVTLDYSNPLVRNIKFTKQSVGGR